MWLSSLAWLLTHQLVVSTLEVSAYLRSCHLVPERLIFVHDSLPLLDRILCGVCVFVIIITAIAYHSVCVHVFVTVLQHLP